MFVRLYGNTGTMSPLGAQRARRRGTAGGRASALRRPPVLPEPPSVGILDAAFRRAHRASPSGVRALDRGRRRAELRVVRSAAVVVRHLRGATRPFRARDLTDFDRTLLARRFGEGALGRAIVRVRRAEERIRRLERDRVAAVRRTVGADNLAGEVRAFYGRLASFVREVDRDLEALRDFAAFFAARPRLDPDRPTLVVAGFPNVGKSSLVARLSSARPAVAEYPFTTRSIEVGHADLGFDRLQVVDTPGVLDREGRANPAETEAATAVEGAARAVLFVLDPSETSGYPIERQEALLARWRAEFPRLPFVVVETKADLRRTGSGRLEVSAKTGQGLDALRRSIEAALARAPAPAQSANL